MKIIYNIGVNILGQPCFATHQIYESQVHRHNYSGPTSPIAESTPDYTLNPIAHQDRMVFYDGVIGKQLVIG